VTRAVARPCRSCGEPVYDLLYPKTGRSAPIEVRLSTNGNVVVDLEAATYRILTGEALAAARRDGSAELHVNHFISCPEREAWLSKRRRP
jgi:hypothetical protein